MPLAAGTLTLQDVLEAHKPAPKLTPPQVTGSGASPSSTATPPLLTPPAESSSTSLMMSQGMKAVLQKVGTATVAPVQVKTSAAQLTAPSLAAAGASGEPTPLTYTAVEPVQNVQYQTGQEPKNLAAAATPAPISPLVAQASATTPSSDPQSASAKETTPAPTCDEHIQKWEKSCDEAGYPDTFTGKIEGETLCQLHRRQFA